jgi:phospholipid/cholesterol/gamma-HCH transport system permease protein
MASVVSAANERLKKMVFEAQGITVFAGKVFARVFSPPFYWRDLYEQIHFLGLGSVYLCVFTGVFAGQAMALQFSKEMAEFGAKDYMGRIVTLANVRALGPVLTGLMVAARVSSGIAAEIGAMKASNQLDALVSFGTDPIKKLAVPRLWALFLMMPILTILTDTIAIIGGWIVSHFIVHVSDALYWTNVRQKLLFGNLLVGMTKPFVFGVIIAIVGCYKGFASEGGTRGVGQATREAVVISSITILVAEFMMTKGLFAILGW